MSLPRTASTVIIGGGVVGCSIAYHLACRGLRDVVLLERETVGSGTTSKAAGGIRVQFPAETEIRFSLESIDVFGRFADEFGVDPGYRKIGYLYLLAEEQQLRGLEPRIALQRKLGADVRVITPADAQKLVPALRVDDLIAAVWGPQDGMPRRGDERLRAPRARPRRVDRRGGRGDGARAIERAGHGREDVPRRGLHAHRRQCRGARGGARRTARRAGASGAPAAAPHLLHRALPRDPGPGAPHE